MPKAGYSRNAHDGRGFRTRLRARAIHLRAGEASIAFVTLDLLGGSSVLQHLVARAIADHTDVPLAGLFLGATHTHAGPGQFSGSAFYNRFASNRPGSIRVDAIPRGSDLGRGDHGGGDAPPSAGRVREHRRVGVDAQSLIPAAQPQRDDRGPQPCRPSEVRRDLIRGCMS